MPHKTPRSFARPATGPGVADARARFNQVSGPGPALSMAAVGHLVDRPALIDTAAELLALHFEVDPKAVRRALSDPIRVKKALVNVAPEGAALIYGHLTSSR